MPFENKKTMTCGIIIAGSIFFCHSLDMNAPKLEHIHQEVFYSHVPTTTTVLSGTTTSTTIDYSQTQK
jgi:hypothetical protein